MFVPSAFSAFCPSSQPKFLRIFRRVRKITKSDYQLFHVCLSLRLSAWKNSAPTGRIFTKFYIWAFFQNLSRKFKFLYNLIRQPRTFHEDQYTFLIISCSFLFKMMYVSDTSCRENQNTHFMLNKVLFDNDNIIRHVRIVYWINKSTDTHSEYVIRIDFPLQQ